MPNHTNRKGQAYYLHQSVRKDGRPHYFCTTKKEGDTLAASIPDGYEFYERPESAQVFLRKRFTSKVTDQEWQMLKGALAHHCELPGWATLIDRTKDALVVYSSDRAEDLLRAASRKASAPEVDDSKIIQMPPQGRGQRPSMLELEEALMETTRDLKQQLMAGLFPQLSQTDDALINRIDYRASANMSPAFKFTPIVARKSSKKKTTGGGKPMKDRLFLAERFHFSRDRWVYLGEGSLIDLAPRLLPHIAKESYYELSL